MKDKFLQIRPKPLPRLSVLLSVMIVVSFCNVPSWASTGNIVTSDLAGIWQIALRGTTGCGLSAMQANVTLNTAGNGTATLVTHGPCGDSTVTGQTFKIISMSANGRGTANLTCGTACGWNFTIQVAPNRSSFSLVDVSPENPGNYVEGEAILSSPRGHIAISDLTGSWQVTLFGETGCGVSAGLVTFTLNSSGVAANATATGHSAGCPDGTVTGLNFTVLSLNPDGSGKVNLTCGPGCGWNFDIQVSPDRALFNLVDVDPKNPSNFYAGVAINNSTAARVVNTNLAGAWQLTTYGETGCGMGSSVSNFTLNASGVATNVTSTSHSAGCGDGHATSNTFTIQNLKADGSGTANLTCGVGCGWNLSIQVSPDRSTFNVVDVSPANPGNFLIGTAIHQ